MELSKEIPKGSEVRDSITTLDRILPPGTCRVVSVLAQGPVRKRLFALGFVQGAVVEAVRAAPLGNPVEYQVKGYFLSLRKEEARLISVTSEGA
ncbi:FeoA family protein [Methanosphaerula palustris]|uniref:FeoA family protein n=1 Tax=Methanosphaerula palustris (strain ATCC BAA-1556 / DSM 19958 / E1-9c) TaxID=521011 RepID=B8GEB1_METPE|nr:FeoA family protein [Methanosphaerula palustris]ACL17612.1 FeoA family protein [Methanosphaerula palustris E1-9c]